MKKVIFKISGMHCVSCAMNIDMELEETNGILESNTNYARQQSEVRFDENKLNMEKIIEIIKNLGYDADI